MKLPLLVTSSVAGLAILISGLSAADAPASAPAPAPAASSASAAPAAPAASSAPAENGPKADLTKLVPASDKKDLTFDKDIAPIFKASCVSCHGGNRPSSGLDLSTKENVLKGGKGKPDIVPGHGDQSKVLLFASDAVVKSEMPPLRARTRAQNPMAALTKDQLALVRAWIDQGAK